MFCTSIYILSIEQFLIIKYENNTEKSNNKTNVIDFNISVNDASLSKYTQFFFNDLLNIAYIFRYSHSLCNAIVSIFDIKNLFI